VYYQSQVEGMGNYKWFYSESAQGNCETPQAAKNEINRHLPYPIEESVEFIGGDDGETIYYYRTNEDGLREVNKKYSSAPYIKKIN